MREIGNVYLPTKPTSHWHNNEALYERHKGRDKQEPAESRAGEGAYILEYSE